MLYSLAGVAPPDVSKDVASSLERFRIETDPRHPSHHHEPVIQRLKSRHSFSKEVYPLNREINQVQIRLWKERYPSASLILVSEHLLLGMIYLGIPLVGSDRSWPKQE